jgi:hypothetical protein
MVNAFNISHIGWNLPGGLRYNTITLYSTFLLKEHLTSMWRISRLLIVFGMMLAGWLMFARPVAAANCYYRSADVGYVCDSEPAPSIFVEPQPFLDSPIERATYAHLQDMTNVYPQPSTAVPPSRNAGDGFLYVTVQAVEQVGDETWYMINPGEWVQSEDLILVDKSEFTGFEVLAQPERLFGWMVADYWYSNEPGAEPAPGALKLPRYTFFEVYDAQEADDGWIWYDIGNGRWMRQTYVSLVDPSPRPQEISANEYWVEIDLYEQTFAAYQGDRMVYAGLVSSGLNRWPTNEGLFQVWDRQAATKMSGAEGKIDYYFIEDVPNTMYFDDEIALHGAYWHDRFGYKHSHGCVNMPLRAAEWIYNWSENAPNDLWVYVHTSEPSHILHREDPQVRFAGG